MLASLYRHKLSLVNSLAIAALMSIGSMALADLELDEDQLAALVDLYHATEGDNWDNNEHWLDDTVNACEWYGVHCHEYFGGTGVFLVLMNNNLTGSLPESLGDMPRLIVLKVNGNGLTGPLVMHAGQYSDLIDLSVNDNLLVALDISPEVAPNLSFLNVSNNLLSGSFPDFLEGRDHLGFVDLSHNLLGGELPEWLADLNLKRLELGDNEFTGNVAPAVAAIADDLEYNPSGFPDSQLRLDLRANQFSGDIGEWIADHAKGFPNWINLCWNDLNVTSSVAAAMLVEEHMDGEFDYCLGRSFEAPQIAQSGSWFHPERSGEGISMMVLDNGHTLIHWFTYAPPEHPPERQAWFSGNRELVMPGFDTIHLHAPIGGNFAQGLPNPGSYPIDMDARMEVLDVTPGSLQTRQYVNMNNVGLDSTSQILEYVQLTQLAGTTCDNQSEFQQFSGAWYHPERSGEGFVVEVLPDDRALVYWFTYAADGSGNQAWVMGDGEFIEDGIVIGTPPPGTPIASVHIEDVRLPTGTVFGEDFNPEAVELQPWGSFDLEFHSEDEASIYWESDMEGFNGSGDYALERLARPLMAECD